MSREKVKILKAKNAGFCFGVRRAIEITSKALKENGTPVYSLGPIIHNPQMIARLEKLGLLVVDDDKKIPQGAKFIIRSHGVPKEIVTRLKRKKVKIIDATCPFVKQAQKIAINLHKKEKCQVVVFGDSDHAEVKAVNSQIDYQALVIGPNDPVPKSLFGKKIGLLSQTTQKVEGFKKLLCQLLDFSKQLVVFNTICSDTSNKQLEVANLAKNCELLIVVGGKNSSNTTKLAQIGEKMGVKTFHIETADELKVDWFSKIDRVGLAAGASTPDFLISEVVKKIKKIR